MFSTKDWTNSIGGDTGDFRKVYCLSPLFKIGGFGVYLFGLVMNQWRGEIEAGVGGGER